MSLLPVDLPKPGTKVKAVIKHYDKWLLETVNLICVDEPDANWRFIEDSCELAHEWNVIYWEQQGA